MEIQRQNRLPQTLANIFYALFEVVTHMETRQTVMKHAKHEQLAAARNSNYVQKQHHCINKT
jgi:hypothetical protein